MKHNASVFLMVQIANDLPKSSEEIWSRSRNMTTMGKKFELRQRQAITGV